MIKLTSKQKKYLAIAVALIFLVGCAVNVSGPEDYYTLETTFSEVWASSKFSAIFVYPISYLINFVVLKLNWGVIMGVGVATFVVNLITFPLTIYSQINTSKMQMLQPEINKINQKYEGRTDQQSVMAKSADTSKLYKESGIKMGWSMIGMLLPFPLLIAMYQAVVRASSLYSETFLGANLNVKPLDGFQHQPNGWVFVVIFVLMAAAQFISMKLPQWLSKRRLESDKKYKKYDKVQSAPAQGAGMMNGMLVMILVMSISMNTTMSVYWFFSSFMNIIKTLVGDYIVDRQQNSKKGNK